VTPFLAVPKQHDYCSHHAFVKMGLFAYANKTTNVDNGLHVMSVRFLQQLN